MDVNRANVLNQSVFFLAAAGSVFSPFLGLSYFASVRRDESGRRGSLLAKASPVHRTPRLPILKNVKKKKKIEALSFNHLFVTKSGGVF